MVAAAPNWAEIVTAVATAVGALGLLSAIGAAIFAGRQVREAERGRQAAMAAEFIRRWDEADLVEARHLIGQYKTPDELKVALVGFIESNSMQAFIMYRELDYFEQLGALDHVHAFDFDLIRLLLGQRLIDRWEMWKPSIDAMGDDVYPMFEALVAKMRAALSLPESSVTQRHSP
jgi:hypothetical protein